MPLNKNGKKFEKPLVEVVEFLAQDIITASDNDWDDMGGFSPWEWNIKALIST